MVTFEHPPRLFDVWDVTYHAHADPDGSGVMEVRYKVASDRCFSEWIVFDGNADSKRWWGSRSTDPYPSTARHAVDIANYHGVVGVRRIAVRYMTGGCRIAVDAWGAAASGLVDVW